MFVNLQKRATPKVLTCLTCTSLLLFLPPSLVYPTSTQFNRYFFCLWDISRITVVVKYLLSNYDFLTNKWTILFRLERGPVKQHTGKHTKRLWAIRTPVISILMIVDFIVNANDQLSLILSHFSLSCLNFCNAWTFFWTNRSGGSTSMTAVDSFKHKTGQNLNMTIITVFPSIGINQVTWKASWSYVHQLQSWLQKPWGNSGTMCDSKLHCAWKDMGCLPPIQPVIVSRQSPTWALISAAWKRKRWIKHPCSLQDD